ncbi:MAG: pyruvate kinase [Burkholderiales bacterium]|nr:pyruvate kinase [Burkholderiales bacterium]
MNHVVQDAWGLETWDTETISATIDELWALRRAMHERAAQLEPWLVKVDPALRPSALNLAHYLALRAVDLRALQDRLAWMGVSSLGRAETHVLANVDKVLGILHRLAGRPWQTLSHEEPIGFTRGPALLTQHAAELFGTAPARRAVRIMVTLPSEAAHDEALVARLVDAGMDIARINCAHDEAPQWRAMAESVRRHATWAGREVRVLMDLGGPKLRTGAVADAPAVVKLQPERDAWGRVTQAARLGLRPSGSQVEVTGAPVCLGVDAGWLARLEVGARINLTDARTSTRRLEVIERQGDGVLLHCEQTAYLTNQVCLRLHQRGQDVYKAWLTDIPPQPGQLHLKRGDLVHVVADGIGRDATVGKKSKVARPAVIACTLPEALAKVRKGEHIWFDDGRIGGVVRRAGAKRLEVQITEARDSGERLAADKGINLPDTHLDLPALTSKDLQDLEVVATCADMVGMSFAQSADDVLALRARLIELGAPQLGLILKIETSRGFEHLPELLLAAMTGPCAGVMIARGDLAVECGYERLAEVQEEILWACEAAHLPVVWATQVLETLAKTGLPSRAEITDAAMGGRAECVMLNKGPHIVLAMQTLDDILTRMQSHQLKKRSLLRALAAWDLPARRKKLKPVRDELSPMVG